METLNAIKLTVRFDAEGLVKVGRMKNEKGCNDFTKIAAEGEEYF